MKQLLQNNFTTPEQSKRLLELGVPADSADMILIREKSGDMQFYDEQYEKQALNWGEKYSDWDTLEWHMTHHILPCWSVGRLREIFCICSSVNGTREYPFCNSQVAWWITEFEFKKEFIDFSKLDE